MNETFKETYKRLRTKRDSLLGAKRQRPTNAAWRQYATPEKPLVITGRKRCKACQVEKDKTEFYQSKGAKCRECFRLRRKTKKENA